MTTIGYSTVQSPLFFDGISILESCPPQCQINFHTMVYWDGHSFDVEHKEENGTIKIYVTLNVPEQGPMKGTPFSEAVNIGVLDPGRYTVLFYFRRKGKEINEEFSLSNAFILIAQGDTELKVKSSDSTEWKAWINARPPGPPILHVTGTVSVNSESTVVNLQKAELQGINFAILLLNIEVDKGPVSGNNFLQKIHYSEPAGLGVYNSVYIMFPNGDSVSIDNIDLVF